MEPTGIINAATRNALNGVERPTSASNIQRIIVNMERWRWLPENLGAFYVWDSVPEQMTSVYDEGKQVLSEKIVVGKPSRRQPIFSADMQFVIFHPSWGVPPGMKANELPAAAAPAGGWFFSHRRLSVLAAHGLRVSRGGQPSTRTRSTGRTSTSTARLHPAAGPDKRAGYRQVPLPQQARHLHARHAGATPVRRRRARLQPWLHARAEPRESGRGAARARQGPVGPRRCRSTCGVAAR